MMKLYSAYKGEKGLKRIVAATTYSLSGFRSAFKNEAAFRQILFLNIILIPLSFFISVSAVEQSMMIAVCLLAIMIELINSAIEATVDRISLERHELSKNAKDMGSAAQFVALTLIVLTWGIILI